MPTNVTKVKFFMKLAGIAIGLTLGLAATYVWLLPRYFNGYKTYYVLIIGLLTAYISSAYIGCSFLTASTLARRIMFGVACGLGVAILVLYSSMLIILNLRGS